MRRALPEGLVESTVKELDIEIIEHRGGEIIALCPGHKRVVGREDRSPSWSINEETGVHYCFSCGFKGNLYTLVRDIAGEGPADELWTQYAEHGRLIKKDAKVQVSISRPTFTARNTSLSESELLMFDEVPEWALKRRRLHPGGTLTAYEIRWDTRREAWILPLRYPDDGSLMGYQVKAERSRMFRNHPRSMPKATTLFGLTAVSLSESRVVIVESPLDAVLLADMGYPAMAVCGSKMSDAQIDLLREFDWTFLWLDNDRAGQTETARLRKELPKRGIRFTQIPWSTHKDPGEMPYGAIDEALSDARY